MNKNNIILTYLRLWLWRLAYSLPACKNSSAEVSENAFNLKEEIDVIKTGTSWFYTWGNVPNNNIKDLPEADFRVCSMCWNANYNADNIRSCANRIQRLNICSVSTSRTSRIRQI